MKKSAIIASLLSLTPLLAVAAGPYAWVEYTGPKPPPRGTPHMTYDAARQEVVMFGGVANDGMLDDTWVWDGSGWTERAVAGPGPRWRAGLAYDYTRERVVLHGGTRIDVIDESNLAVTRLDDTWEWDGTSWVEVVSTTKPPVIIDENSLAWDGTRIILFGGLVPNTPSPTYTNETWGWDGTDWSLLSTTGPSPRGQHSLFWTGSDVILMGGTDGSATFEGVTTFKDIWRWNGTSWSEVDDDADFPLGRYCRGLIAGEGLGYGAWETYMTTPAGDPTFQTAGFCGTYSFYWGGGWPPEDAASMVDWNGTVISPASTSNIPPARGHTAIAYHEAQQQIVLFGGVLPWDGCVPPSLKQALPTDETWLVGDPVMNARSWTQY